MQTFAHKMRKSQVSRLQRTGQPDVRDNQPERPQSEGQASHRTGWQSDHNAPAPAHRRQ